MKKLFIVLTLFFWSMIFPSISFNKITTEITSNNINYSDLYNIETRKEILKNAEFDFKLFPFNF